MVISNAKYAKKHGGLKNWGHTPDEEQFLAHAHAGPAGSAFDLSEIEIPLLRELRYLQLSELEE
ncbi:MAG TPA: hypothetical protein V6C52_10625 [Coleofasciculaceae cyanobacterium]|jgi:hypothetical protein